MRLLFINLKFHVKHEFDCIQTLWGQNSADKAHAYITADWTSKPLKVTQVRAVDDIIFFHVTYLQMLVL